MTQQDLKQIGDLFDKKFDEKFEKYALVIQGQFAIIDKRLEGLESRLGNTEVAVASLRSELNKKPNREEFPAWIYSIKEIERKTTVI